MTIGRWNGRRASIPRRRRSSSLSRRLQHGTTPNPCPKGVKPLQFSWANTLIDPTSVELKFLTNPEKLEVLDTTFPHDKPQMLYWNVQSDFDGEASIEITYFTSGITWKADYLAIAD